MMLDRIDNNINNNSEQIAQNASLSQLGAVGKYGAENPIEEDRKSYFVDESLISPAALQKFQHEQDISKFSAFLKDFDQKTADSLVLSNVFGGSFSIGDEDILFDLLNSKEFLNDIFEETP